MMRSIWSPREFLLAEERYGPQAVWPYYYAGTMGLVMRDGINRLRYAKKYSGFFETICNNLAWTASRPGPARFPVRIRARWRNRTSSIIWGTNAVNTQVNVMTHASRARKRRGAKIVAVDVYMNGTMEQADLPVLIRPGTDGALACALMHCLFRDGKADWDYLDRYTDAPRELAEHVRSRDPQWASRITDCPVETIEAFAALIGERKRAFFRLGYGFSRSRNGAANMHAASCIPAVTGAWLYEGGGAFYNNRAIYHWNKTMIEGLDVRDPSIRLLDQSRIGAVLTGESGSPVERTAGGGHADPEYQSDVGRTRSGNRQARLCARRSVRVRARAIHDRDRGSRRRRVARHHVPRARRHLPGRRTPIHSARAKLIEPAGECRSNHDVICALAHRLGAKHPGFEMTPRELIDWTLTKSGWGSLPELEQKRWIDCQPDFDTAHYINGFAWPGGKFRFKPDWPNVPFRNPLRVGPIDAMPKLPDHWEVIEEADAEHPFRLATSPARGFLNSTFTEMPTSRAKEGRPNVMIHPEDAAAHEIADGAPVMLGNARGQVRLRARHFDGVCRGVLIAESVWPNNAYEDGRGINTLTGADAVAPFGGAAFHDNKVWIRRAG